MIRTLTVNRIPATDPARPACPAIMFGHHCQSAGPHAEHEARYQDPVDGQCELRWYDT